MADLSPPYASHFDANQVPTAMGVVGTLGTSDTKGTAKPLPPSVDPTTGAWHVKDLSGAAIPSWDNVAVTYPTGTTEVYNFKVGTTSVGTMTLTYSDSTKGSLTLAERA